MVKVVVLAALIAASIALPTTLATDFKYVTTKDYTDADCVEGTGNSSSMAIGVCQKVRCKGQ